MFRRTLILLHDLEQRKVFWTMRRTEWAGRRRQTLDAISFIGTRRRRYVLVETEAAQGAFPNRRSISKHANQRKVTYTGTDDDDECKEAAFGGDAAFPRSAPAASVAASERNDNEASRV